MKLVIVLAAFAEAGKGGRRGKHGNVDMTTARWLWKVPKCIQDEVLCDKKELFTEPTGSIILSSDDYQNFKVNL